MDTLEATYRLKYSASDGKRNRPGTLVQGIRYTNANGRLSCGRVAFRQDRIAASEV